MITALAILTLALPFMFCLGAPLSEPWQDDAESDREALVHSTGVDVPDKEEWLVSATLKPFVHREVLAWGFALIVTGEN